MIGEPAIVSLYMLRQECFSNEPPMSLKAGGAARYVQGEGGLAMWSVEFTRPPF